MDCKNTVTDVGCDETAHPETDQSNKPKNDCWAVFFLERKDPHVFRMPVFFLTHNTAAWPPASAAQQRMCTTQECGLTALHIDKVISRSVIAGLY